MGDPFMDQAILNTFNNFPLRRLIDYQLKPGQEHWIEYKIVAMRSRTELSISFGNNALQFCSNSKLWHQYQNGLAQFPGGFFQTMHHSYLGNYSTLTGMQVCKIFDDHPNIRTLNIILDLGSVAEQFQNEMIINVPILIYRYAKQLVSLKLWARGPMIPAYGCWDSILMIEFASRLWYVLGELNQCHTLWLDLDEEVPPDVQLAPPPIVPLEAYLQDRNATLQALKRMIEFRFVARHIDCFTVLQQCNFDIGSRDERVRGSVRLQRIHILNLFPLDSWNTLGLEFAKRFQEITVSIERRVVADIENLFDKFHALTRVNICLAQAGPRFISVFRALTHVPNLQVLALIIQQLTLFTLEEALALKRLSQNGAFPPRLLALQVLSIDMNMIMESCTSITVAPLFPGQTPGEQSNRQPVPNLVCFGMSIQEGRCELCLDRQDDCIRDAVLRWFEPLPRIAIVGYSNRERYLTRESTIRDVHQVIGNIANAPELLPDAL